MFDYKQQETTDAYRDGWERIWGRVERSLEQIDTLGICFKCSRITNYYNNSLLKYDCGCKEEG